MKFNISWKENGKQKEGLYLTENDITEKQWSNVPAIFIVCGGSNPYRYFSTYNEAEEKLYREGKVTFYKKQYDRKKPVKITLSDIKIEKR